MNELISPFIQKVTNEDGKTVPVTETVDGVKRVAFEKEYQKKLKLQDWRHRNKLSVTFPEKKSK